MDSGAILIDRIRIVLSIWLVGSKRNRLQGPFPTANKIRCSPARKRTAIEDSPWRAAKPCPSLQKSCINPSVSLLIAIAIRLLAVKLLQTAGSNSIWGSREVARISQPSSTTFSVRLRVVLTIFLSERSKFSKRPRPNICAGGL